MRRAIPSAVPGRFDMDAKLVDSPRLMVGIAEDTADADADAAKAAKGRARASEAARALTE
jgi:hypothetical protein